MNELTEIIGLLTLREVDKLKHHLSSSRLGKGDLRYILFLRLINGKRVDDITSSKTQIDAVGRRLVVEIHDVLSQERLVNTGISAFHKARQTVRKLIINAELFWGRGGKDACIVSLKKAEKLAVKFELNVELLNIYDLLQQYLGQNKSLELYNHYKERRKFQLERCSLHYEANEIFRSITLPSFFKKGSTTHSTNETDIERLSEIYKKTKSVEVYSKLLRSELFNHHLNRDYQSALKNATELKDLINDNKLLNSKANIAGSYMQIGIIQLYLHDFSSTESWTRKALKFFKRKTANELRALNILFRSLLFQNNFSDAEVVLQIAQKNPLKKKLLYDAQWSYNLANLKFCNSDFSGALQILQKRSELLSDRSGWRIGFKVLEIMAIYKLGYFDWLDLRLETFYRLVKSSKSEVNSRPMMIYRCFKLLNKHKLNGKANEELKSIHKDLLQSDGSSWDPMGYELIRFDRWLEKEFRITRAEVEL